MRNLLRRFNHDLLFNFTVAEASRQGKRACDDVSLRYRDHGILSRALRVLDSASYRLTCCIKISNTMLNDRILRERLESSPVRPIIFARSRHFEHLDPGAADINTERWAVFFPKKSHEPKVYRDPLP